MMKLHPQCNEIQYIDTSPIQNSGIRQNNFGVSLS